MTGGLTEPLLSRFGEFIAVSLGLHFPPERATDLQRGIQSAAHEFGFADTEACVRWLLSTPLAREQVEILAGHLTVGETYFFRDKRVFEVLEEQILPELLRERREGEQRLRLWSAACCSGEEAYSLAISVRKALPNLADWQVTILGTDINPRFLGKAARGVYGEWSFRDAPAGFRERHFTRTGDGRWEILPEIRKIVNFCHLNLAADVYPSLLNNTNAMDLVFCRNVLIYFAAGPAGQVIRNLTPCLAEDGWLVLGPNEVSHVARPDLALRRFPGVTLFQKDSTGGRGTGIRPPRKDGPGETPASFSPPADAATAASATSLSRHGTGVPIPAEAAVPRRPVELAPPTAYEQALAFYREGYYAETVAALAGPASIEPVEARILTLLARTLANQGKLAEGLATCDRMIAAEKMNPGGHYLRASILQELGDLAEATLAFRRALYLDQDFVLAHFALGNLARRQEKFPEADRHFANTLALARRHHPDEILPEADGLTAGRLAEIVATLQEAEAAV